MIRLEFEMVIEHLLLSLWHLFLDVSGYRVRGKPRTIRFDMVVEHIHRIEIGKEWTKKKLYRKPHRQEKGSKGASKDTE